METDSKGVTLIKQMITENQIFDIVDESLIEDKELSGDSTIFLLDEWHHDDKSIDENVSFARGLIEAGQIDIVGVEGYQSGCVFEDLRRNLNDPCVVGNCLRFPIGVDARCRDSLIVGIDSKEMCTRIKDGLEIDDIPYNDNPLQEDRSKLFINSLLQEINKRNISGNAILNAGSRHNVDIINFVRKNEIELLKELNYSFVRIRSESHPGKNN